MRAEDILSSHVRRTTERAGGHEVVLSINDSTSFNLSTHKATEGLGCLSTKAGEIGFLLHDTVVFTPRGVPLGVLDAQMWKRDVKEHGKRREKKKKSIEEKESSKWLKSLLAMARAQKEVPETRFVSVGDREADIYELFELALELGCNLLVRSAQNRKTSEDIKVWDLIESEAPAGKMSVRVRGRNKRVREAELEIRYRRVVIQAPKDRRKKGEVTLWGISAREVYPPEGEKALHWRLLTNIEVRSFEDACEKVEWYSIRFSIETFHRILKSGCRIEDKRLGYRERIERCLAIDMITAWRLMYLTKSGRETPEIESEFFFDEDEIEVLKRIKYGRSYDSQKSLSLNEAIMTIAKLGGFVSWNRVPGVEVMWRGLRRFEDIVSGVLLMKEGFFDDS